MGRGGAQVRESWIKCKGCTGFGKIPGDPKWDPDWWKKKSSWYTPPPQKRKAK